MEEFCPRCGTARVGAFRFCRSCRLDFDVFVVASAVTPVAPVESRVLTAGRSLRRSAGQSFLATGILMLVGIAAIGGIQRIDIESATSTAHPVAGTGATAAKPTSAGPVGGGGAGGAGGAQSTTAPAAQATTFPLEPRESAKPAKEPQPKPDQEPRRGVFGNPWGYDFRAGETISDPPADFCDYFDCTADFWDEPAGYVVQCKDRTFSRSGGLEGACADNGGVRRTLSRH